MTDLKEIEEDRRDSLQRLKSDDPNWSPENYEPGTFGCHEALHVASLASDLVAGRLCEHSAVVINPEWYRLAWEAHDALFRLYQAIGKAHLEAPDK